VTDYQGSIVREGVYFGECPRWHDGRLWYSDFFDHAVHALAPGGADERVVEVAGQPSGLGWQPDGSLLIVSMVDRRVLRLSPDGSLAEHADLTEWAPFHCNDMVVDAAGRAYVGNFGFDIYPRMAGGQGEPARAAALIRVDPDGQVSVAAEDLEFPNGTVITPDGQTLIIAESGGRRLTAFDVSASGELFNRRVWADLRPHQVSPDGICLDASGAVWAANAAGTTVVRVAEGGELLDTARFTQTCFACMLGGTDGRELFAMTAPSALPEQAAASPRARIESVRVSVGHAGLP
jgi:sugar lactone lactonase YvrE